MQVFRGLVHQPRRRMRVGIQRELDRAVAQETGHHLRVHAIGQAERRRTYNTAAYLSQSVRLQAISSQCAASQTPTDASQVQLSRTVLSHVWSRIYPRAR